MKIYKTSYCGLLASVLVIATAFIAVTIQRSHEQSFMVKMIERAGGEVAYDWQVIEENEINYSDTKPPVGFISSVFGIDACHNVVYVHFPRKGDDYLLHQCVGTLRDIEQLNLAYCDEITDRGISSLVQLKQLKILWLYRNVKDHKKLDSEQSVSNKSLKYLASISSLQELYIWDNPFTDEGVKSLRALSNLEKLGVGGGGVTEEGIDCLQKILPRCRINQW